LRKHRPRLASQKACDGPRHLINASASAAGLNPRAERGYSLMRGGETGQLGRISDDQPPAELFHLGEQAVVDLEPRDCCEAVIRDFHEFGVEQATPLQQFPYGTVA